MRLTPAQERTLWEMDRAKMGARDGRQGWLSASHWNSRTLAALERHGLLERHRASEYVVRLTPAGTRRCRRFSFVS